MGINRAVETRLAQIRKDLEKHRALGFDVETWEASFFLELIGELRAEIKRLTK